MKARRHVTDMSKYVVQSRVRGGTWHASLQWLLSQSGNIRHDCGPPLLLSSEGGVWRLQDRSIPRCRKHTAFAQCVAVCCPDPVQSPLHVFQRHGTKWENDGRGI